MKIIMLFLCLFVGIVFSWETVGHDVIEKYGVDVSNLKLTVKECYNNNRKVIRSKFINSIEAHKKQIVGTIPQENRKEYIVGGVGGANILEIMSELCAPNHKFVKFSTELSNIVEQLEVEKDDLKQLEFTSSVVRVLVYEFGTLSEQLDGKF